MCIFEHSIRGMESLHERNMKFDVPDMGSEYLYKIALLGGKFFSKICKIRVLKTPTSRDY